MSADQRLLELLEALADIVQAGANAGLEPRAVAAVITAYGVSCCAAARMSPETLHALVRQAYAEAAQELDPPPAGFRPKGWKP